MAFPPLVGLVVATLLLVWYFKKVSKKSKEIPQGLKEIPGPTGLPWLGSVLQMGKYPNKQFCKWTEQYGDIYKVKLGHQNIVVVSDPKMAKDLFMGDPAFAGRPFFEGFDMYLDTPRLGIINSEGEPWEVHRRFTLRQLRDFGFGKSAMETLIMEEVNEVLERLVKQEGKPVANFKEMVKLAVVNSLWTILTSKRMNQDDPKLTHLSVNTNETFNEVLEQGGFLIFFPWLRHIIPDLSGYNRIRAMFDENREFFVAHVLEHKAAFQEDDLKDFIDVYLAEMKKAEGDSKSVFHGEKAEKFLIASMFDFFTAGSETTSSTLSWTLLYLSKYPETQKKLQKEIEEITGNSRKVSVTDRPNMPYTLALIDEVLRFSTLVPDGVQHRAMADREFQGYFIPKDALLQPNLWHIHHNPKTWGDPENFRPERFLSKDGKKYTRNENVQAFQIGRRQCVGETLARDTLFLYITNIFQQFSIGFDPNSPEGSLDAIVSFVRTPKPFKVVMKNRLTN